MDVKAANQYQSLRGPDRTTELLRGGTLFLHNLLSITGQVRPQPFASDRYTVLYNGEIYNANQYGSFASDGECIIPAIEMFGDFFSRHLDGEYAIVLQDHFRGRLLFSRDTFGTKPLYFAEDDRGVALASYPSALRGLGFTEYKMVPPNKIFSYSLADKKLVELGEITNFSLRQYKTYYDDWFLAFDKSIEKRVKNVREKLFIGLSSGYDSGAICASLMKTGVPFVAYSIMENENLSVMEERKKLISGHGNIVPLSLSDLERSFAVQHNEQNIENLYYGIYTAFGDYNEFSKRLHDDTGAIGLSAICARAKADGRKIYLSGQGADEILSDYGFQGKRIYRHSNFGGLFPERLESIFPWPSFYGSSQSSYLMKEEHVSGSYGIEGRYPFLDVQVVQEFLSLDVSLKNRSYKSALYEYLQTEGYPFCAGEKRGFVV